MPQGHRDFGFPGSQCEKTERGINEGQWSGRLSGFSSAFRFDTEKVSWEKARGPIVPFLGPKLVRELQ